MRQDRTVVFSREDQSSTVSILASLLQSCGYALLLCYYDLLCSLFDLLQTTVSFVFLLLDILYFYVQMIANMLSATDDAGSQSVK